MDISAIEPIDLAVMVSNHIEAKAYSFAWAVRIEKLLTLLRFVAAISSDFLCGEYRRRQDHGQEYAAWGDGKS